MTAAGHCRLQSHFVTDPNLPQYLHSSLRRHAGMHGNSVWYYAARADPNPALSSRERDLNTRSSSSMNIHTLFTDLKKRNTVISSFPRYEYTYRRDGLLHRQALRCGRP